MDERSLGGRVGDRPSRLLVHLGFDGRRARTARLYYSARCVRALHGGAGSPADLPDAPARGTARASAPLGLGRLKPCER